MNKSTIIGIEMSLGAVFLAVAGDYILRADAGLNIFVWFVLLIATIAAIAVRRKPELWTTTTIALCVALLFFASMFAVYTSIAVLLLNFAAMSLVLVAIVVPTVTRDIRSSSIFHYFAAAFIAGINSLIGPGLVLGNDIEWKSVPRPSIAKQLFSTLKGLAVAVPILVVIGALLMNADAAFETFVTESLRIDTKFLVEHTIIISILTWIILGYLRSVLFGISLSNDTPSTAPSMSATAGVPASVSAAAPAGNVSNTNQPPKVVNNPTSGVPSKSPAELLESMVSKFRLGTIELSVILGLMNIVFIVFVIFQVPYLFGGMDLVQQTPDFKLADYARRGISELMNVSLLVLPILLGLHWLIKKDNPIHEKVFRVLAGIQIGLLFVIMASAAQRLFLLTGSLGYGFSEYRFYAFILLIWLTLVFLWLGLTVLRGARRQFAFGTLWVTLFVVGMVNFINPADFIVRKNIELKQQGRDFDLIYNANLGDDAVPALLENRHLFAGRNLEIINNGISMSTYLENDPVWKDWRSLNWSRTKAMGLRKKYAGQIGKPWNMYSSDFVR